MLVLDARHAISAWLVLDDARMRSIPCIHGERLHGLFDVWSFTNVTALVASGLGGGSLIYANVMLAKPPRASSGTTCAPAPSVAGRSSPRSSRRLTTK